MDSAETNSGLQVISWARDARHPAGMFDGKSPGVLQNWIADAVRNSPRAFKVERPMFAMVRGAGQNTNEVEEGRDLSHFTFHW